MADAILDAKICCKCGLLKQLTDFHVLKSRLDGRKSYCKSCVKIESAERYKENPEKRKHVNKVWRESNPKRMDAARVDWASNNKARLKASAAAWYRRGIASGRDMSAWATANPEERKKVAQKWRKANPSIKNASTAARFSMRLRATPNWADMKIISRFYADASNLSFKTGERHHVDHIVPLRSDVVCGLHVQANLQVLTGIQNMSKGNRIWPDMP